MQFLGDKTNAYFADEGGAAAMKYGLLAALIWSFYWVGGMPAGDMNRQFHEGREYA